MKQIFLINMIIRESFILQDVAIGAPQGLPIVSYELVGLGSGNGIQETYRV